MGKNCRIMPKYIDNTGVKVYIIKYKFQGGYFK